MTATMLRRLILFACLLLSPALFAQTAQKPLLIAAAADLKFALDDVLTAFRAAQPGLDPRPTYGSSGTLFAQIDNGAPFDLFLAADVKFPRQLIERGRAEKDTLFSYAVGHLVVWVPRDSPLDVARLGIRALLEPGVRKIAIANPQVAPYGAAAAAAIEHFGLSAAVKSRLVLGENVAQTAQFVQSGAADIGLISLSLAVAPPMKDAGRFWNVPEDAFPRLEQAGVICTGGENRAGAVALKQFLAAPAGREVLRRYGFVLPEAAR